MPLTSSGSYYYFPNAYDGVGRLFTIKADKYVSGYRYAAYGIRPVVKLKPNLMVGSGTGTSTDKYTLSNNFAAPVVEDKTGLITGYWQNWNSSSTVNLRVKDVSSNYDIVALGFGYTYTGSTKGTVNFTIDEYLSGYLDGYTAQNLKDDIRVLQLRGQKVILSVGGADNTIVVDDNASVTNLVNSTYSLIQDYGFDGIDINFETGMSPTYLAEAIKQLAAKVGEDFILTMAPQTIDFKVNSSGVASGDYYNLIAEVKDLITIVNLQLYNSGTQYGLDGNVYTQGTVDFATALITILIEKGLDQSQVGIGSNYSSSSGGYMTPSKAKPSI
jgi:chitinase